MRSLWILLTFSLLLGCDWRAFDDLSATATVQVLDAPEQYSGTMFGQVATHLLDSAGKKVPGLVLIGGQGNGSFALLDFRKGQQPKTLSLAVELSHSFTVEALVPLVAEGSNYRFASSSLSTVSLFTLTETEAGFTLTLLNTIERADVEGLGRNILPLGTPYGEDLALASADQVFLQRGATELLTPLPTEGLTLPPTGGATLNVPFLGRLTVDGSELLAVGGSAEHEGSQRWAVRFVDLDHWEQSFTLHGSDKTPGSAVLSLLLVDLNNDGIRDLLVGVEQRVYLFLAQEGTQGVPFTQEPNLIFSSPEQHLGELLAVGDLDGNGRLELLSADPNYSPGPGRDNLGCVALFLIDLTTAGQGSTIPPALELFANSKEKKFGSSLVTVPSSTLPGQEELVVGGENSSYLFYLTGLPGDNAPADDPRNHPL